MPSLQRKGSVWYVVWYDRARKTHHWESLARFNHGQQVTAERTARRLFPVWLRLHQPIPPTDQDVFWAKYAEHAKHHKRPYTFSVDNRRIEAFRRWCRLLIGATVDGRNWEIRFLGDITRDHIEAFRRQLSCGPVTRKRYVETLRAAFNVAIDWGLLATNPAGKIKPEPNYTPRPTRALTDAEVQTILTSFPPDERAFCALGIFAGLRRAEIAHLEWSDVDLAQDTVRIAPKPDLDFAPKSTRHTGEIAVVPLESRLKAILTALPCGTRFVFDNGAGRPRYRDINTWTVRVLKLMRQHNIAGNIHSMRHTFITRMATAGVHPLAMKELARHSDLKTTLRYTHLTTDDLRKELAKLQGR